MTRPTFTREEAADWVRAFGLSVGTDDWSTWATLLRDGLELDLISWTARRMRRGFLLPPGARRMLLFVRRICRHIES